MRRAEGQQAFAEKELERYKGLASRNVVPQQIVNEFEAKAETTKAERDTKRAELKEVEIRLKQVVRRGLLIQAVREKSMEPDAAPPISTEPPPPAPR